MKIINAIIRLRRDNDYNFETIKNTFIPANGEVVLVDTAGKGLRAKVGDGITTWANLNYTDEGLRQEIQNVIIRGYYHEGLFYADQNYQVAYTPSEGALYIDASKSNVYWYSNGEYVGVHETLPAATASTPGVMKLYTSKGENTDGTITQKLFSNEIDKKIEATVDVAQEMLIFG